MGNELKSEAGAAVVGGVSAAQTPLGVLPPAGDASGRAPSWVLLTGLLLFIGHLPLLAMYLVNLMDREAYQFAPLAVAGVAAVTPLRRAV
jgi:uncharacterized membrane protein YgdD (TMEM256/DUF423 family)